jgi:hypothetical protein
VCKEALFYKHGGMGISANFFNCLKLMYSSSKTRIKLIQKLSSKIDITIGTEQNHPLSPELFKMLIHDPSARLSDLADLSVPLLNDLLISHLPWVDDLTLLALDAKSLQTQLDCLHEFVMKWELSIDVQMTNLMVFNKGSKLLNCSYAFKQCYLAVAPIC